MDTPERTGFTKGGVPPPPRTPESLLICFVIFFCLLTLILFVAIGFSGNQFKGEIMPTLLELVEKEIIRIIDQNMGTTTTTKAR